MCRVCPCKMLGWMKHKLESRLFRRNIANIATLVAQSKEELKCLLMKVKEESEKNWLKTQHSKTWDHEISPTSKRGEGESSDRFNFLGLTLKNWCFWAVMLEKILESPLDCKEIQPGYPKGNKSWRFIGRTDAEAETPIPWPPDEKSWFTWKDPNAGKNWK